MASLQHSLSLLTLASAMTLAGCGSTPNIGSESQRDALTSRAQASLDDFKRTDPTLQPILDSSYAYVIFPDISTGAVGVGGAYGRGEVFRNGTMIGYADVSQGSIGVQLGGQKYAELIVFKTATPFVDFSQSTLEFDARASAIAAASGAAATADYSRGVVIFSLPQGGLMFQAAIGGQKFRYTPVNP
jgi:lipid-binding SYLF domain-containing protein